MLLLKADEFLTEDCVRVSRHLNKRPYPLHGHEFIELVYTESGGAVHTIDGAEYTTVRGDLLFVDRGQSHGLVPQGEVTYVNLLLEPRFFSEELMDAESIVSIFRNSLFAELRPDAAHVGHCVHFRGEEQKAVEGLINTMLREQEQKEAGYLSALRSGMQMLFTWMLRRMQADAVPPVESVAQDVLEYIDEHFTERLVLSEVAARGFYDPGYFSRLLKRTCGKNFSEYIKEKRIRMAYELILNNDYSVADVMQRCGYNDTKLFYRHFREICGTVPGDIKKTEKPKMLTE